jgi:hypothetical protein
MKPSGYLGILGILFIYNSLGLVKPLLSTKFRPVIGSTLHRPLFHCLGAFTPTGKTKFSIVNLTHICYRIKLISK